MALKEMQANGQLLEADYFYGGTAKVELVINCTYPDFFLIDTGSHFSNIPRSYVENWGLGGAIEPCSLPMFDGVVAVHVSYDDGTGTDVVISEEFRFYVDSVGLAFVIGMDFLTSANCVIDLAPDMPRLWLHSQPKNLDEDHLIQTDVIVNGICTDSMLDTGLFCLCQSSMEVAKELKLEPEEMQVPLRVSTCSGIETRNYEARDVAVEALGREVRGALSVTDGVVEILVVGMPFLMGARIVLFDTGDWDVTFPPRNWDPFWCYLSE